MLAPVLAGQLKSLCGRAEPGVSNQTTDSAAAVTSALNICVTAVFSCLTGVSSRSWHFGPFDFPRLDIGRFELPDALVSAKFDANDEPKAKGPALSGAHPVPFWSIGRNRM